MHNHNPRLFFKPLTIRKKQTVRVSVLHHKLKAVQLKRTHGINIDNVYYNLQVYVSLA